MSLLPAVAVVLMLGGAFDGLVAGLIGAGIAIGAIAVGVALVVIEQRDVRRRQALATLRHVAAQRQPPGVIIPPPSRAAQAQARKKGVSRMTRNDRTRSRAREPFGKFMLACGAVLSIALALGLTSAVAAGPTVPYTLPVTLPATTVSPPVDAAAPYTPTVLSLIAQLEAPPLTLAKIQNASTLLHDGTNTTCHAVGPVGGPVGLDASGNPTATTLVGNVTTLSSQTDATHIVVASATGLNTAGETIYVGARRHCRGRHRRLGVGHDDHAQLPRPDDRARERRERDQRSGALRRRLEVPGHQGRERHRLRPGRVDLGRQHLGRRARDDLERGHRRRDRHRHHADRRPRERARHEREPSTSRSRRRASRSSAGPTRRGSTRPAARAVPAAARPTGRR